MYTIRRRYHVKKWFSTIQFTVEYGQVTTKPFQEKFFNGEDEGTWKFPNRDIVMRVTRNPQIRLTD